MSQPNYHPAGSPANMQNILKACQSDTAYLADLLTSCSKPTRAAKTLQTLNEKLSWLLNLDREREQAKKLLGSVICGQIDSLNQETK